jgi:hypothetical protein
MQPGKEQAGHSSEGFFSLLWTDAGRPLPCGSGGTGLLCTLNWWEVVWDTWAYMSNTYWVPTVCQAPFWAFYICVLINSHTNSPVFPILQMGKLRH